jgi:hypothetical protein
MRRGKGQGSAYKSYDSKEIEPKEIYAGERDARDNGGVERMDEGGLGREIDERHANFPVALGILLQKWCIQDGRAGRRHCYQPLATPANIFTVTCKRENKLYKSHTKTSSIYLCDRRRVGHHPPCESSTCTSSISQTIALLSKLRRLKRMPSCDDSFSTDTGPLATSICESFLLRCARVTSRVIRLTLIFG